MASENRELEIAASLLQESDSAIAGLPHRVIDAREAIPVRTDFRRVMDDIHLARKRVAPLLEEGSGEAARVYGRSWVLEGLLLNSWPVFGVLECRQMLRAFEKALEYLPTSGRAHYGAAMAKLELGDRRGALKHLQSAETYASDNELRLDAMKASARIQDGKAPMHIYWRGVLRPFGCGSLLAILLFSGMIVLVVWVLAG